MPMSNQLPVDLGFLNGSIDTKLPSARMRVSIPIAGLLGFFSAGSMAAINPTSTLLSAKA